MNANFNSMSRINTKNHTNTIQSTSDLLNLNNTSIDDHDSFNELILKYNDTYSNYDLKVDQEYPIYKPIIDDKLILPLEHMNTNCAIIDSDGRMSGKMSIEPT